MANALTGSKTCAYVHRMNIYESDIELAHRTCDREFVKATMCDSLSLKGKSFLVNETGTIVYDVECSEGAEKRKKHDCTRADEVHRTKLVAYDIPPVILYVHSNVCVFFVPSQPQKYHNSFAKSIMPNHFQL